jgi:hypothetical protein
VAKDLLLDARKAAEDHAWEEAYDAFRAADSRDGLPPEDLDLMSESAFWAGHAAEAIDARQRAHRAYIDEGRPADAAWSALITSLLLLASGDRSLASGWLGKGQRLLVDLP